MFGFIKRMFYATMTFVGWGALNSSTDKMCINEQPRV